MTKYLQGVRAEYRAREELYRQGYATVLRAAGSHGPADLVAVGATRVKFVQVKSTVQARPDFSRELAALRAWQVPEPCAKELWIWQRQGRKWLILPA